MFETKVIEKITTHILYTITFTENRAVYEITRRNCRAVQATDDNMAHTRYMLDT
jgi:hypothetical protein